MDGTSDTPPPVPADPSEGRERYGPDRRVDPDPRYATPEWRREPTTEFDPRKGR